MYGAYYNKRNKNKKWTASVKHDGKTYAFGSYTSAQAASEAAHKGKAELQLAEPALLERNAITKREERRLSSSVVYQTYCGGTLCKKKPSDERQVVVKHGEECITCYEADLLGAPRLFRSYSTMESTSARLM